MTASKKRPTKAQSLHEFSQTMKSELQEASAKDAQSYAQQVSPVPKWYELLLSAALGAVLWFLTPASATLCVFLALTWFCVLFQVRTGHVAYLYLFLLAVLAVTLQVEAAVASGSYMGTFLFAVVGLLACSVVAVGAFYLSQADKLSGMPITIEDLSLICISGVAAGPLVAVLAFVVFGVTWLFVRFAHTDFVSFYPVFALLLTLFMMLT